MQRPKLYDDENRTATGAGRGNASTLQDQWGQGLRDKECWAAK